MCSDMLALLQRNLYIHNYQNETHDIFNIRWWEKLETRVVCAIPTYNITPHMCRHVTKQDWTTKRMNKNYSIAVFQE